MRQDIVIKRINIDHLVRWACRGADAVAWLAGAGLIAAGSLLAGAGFLFWLLGGADPSFGTSLLGGIVLGTAGVFLLLRRLELLVRVLRGKTAPAQGAEDVV